MELTEEQAGTVAYMYRQRPARQRLISFNHKIPGEIVSVSEKELHMGYRHCIILALTLFCCASSTRAEDDYSVRVDPVTKARFLIFKSDKGDVRFNHDLHQSMMKSESCIPCHRTETPTRQRTMTRFDQRIAHYFCKGCHREKGRGPVECHECHKIQK